jgi:hypothetical protein
MSNGAADRASESEAAVEVDARQLLRLDGRSSLLLQRIEVDTARRGGRLCCRARHCDCAVSFPSINRPGDSLGLAGSVGGVERRWMWW